MHSSVHQSTLKLYADLESRYRPQRVWADGRGRLVVVAHFFCGMGAGSWLLGLILGSRVVSLLGLLAVVTGCLFHLVFLGHPERTWRMLRGLRSSWISRGLLATVVFVPASILYLVPAFVPSAPWEAAGPFGLVMLVFSLLGIAGVFLSSGFVYEAARPVALWHSPLQPPLSVALGLRGGAALALVCLPFSAFTAGTNAVQTWWLAATAAFLFLFLLEAGTAHGDRTVAWSLHRLWSGRNARISFVGWTLIGVVLPAALVIASYSVSLAAAGFVLAGVTSLIGDLFFRQETNAAGTFVPLVSEDRLLTRV
jgi:DMSO reductase anchor subunit